MSGNQKRRAITCLSTKFVPCNFYQVSASWWNGTGHDLKQTERNKTAKENVYRLVTFGIGILNSNNLIHTYFIYNIILTHTLKVWHISKCFPHNTFDITFNLKYTPCLVKIMQNHLKKNVFYLKKFVYISAIIDNSLS